MKNTDSNEHCTESTFRGKTKLPKEMDKNLIKIKEFSSLKTSFCITSIICLIITLIAVCISISVIRKDLNELKNDFSGDNETVSTLKENYDDIFEQLSELSSQIDSERLLNEKALNKIEKKILEREELISEVQDELNQLKLEIENIKTSLILNYLPNL
jgi:DNA repair exonuclease SbcCD ATPase subunit